MLKFFRKIRQNLLAEGQAGKYLKYALGEIVLVVIGILIALQINTWNNDRIENVKEKKVLQELKTGFELDLKVIENESLEINKSLDNIQQLKDIVGNPAIRYSPGLDSLFGAIYGVRNVRLTLAFYEDLKASGLALIRSDDIRLNIVKLFEDNYEFIRRMMEMETSINEITRPYYLQHFRNLAFTKSATPNEFNQVWNDPYYKNIIHYRQISLDSNQRQIYERTIPLLKKLIRQINDYTNQMNND